MWSNHSLNQYNHFQSNYQLFPSSNFNSNSTFVSSSNSASASSSSASSSSANPSSFLSNVLNQNFTVEHLMNQYELDLESILQEQKDNDDYSSSDDDENDEDKEREKDKEEEEEREKRNFIIDGIVHTNVMIGENSTKKKEKEEDEKLTVLKKRPIKKNKPFISFTEAEFLKKVLMIKKRISKLTKEYHLLNGSIDVTKREIEDLDLLKDKNDDFNNLAKQILLCHMDSSNENIQKICERNELIYKVIEPVRFLKEKQMKEKKDKSKGLLEKITMMKKIISYKCEDDGNVVNPDDIMCTICLENKKVQYCMDPCGHVFCDSCTVRIQTNCHICRNRVSKKVKMYF